MRRTGCFRVGSPTMGIGCDVCRKHEDHDCFLQDDMRGIHENRRRFSFNVRLNTGRHSFIARVDVHHPFKVGQAAELNFDLMLGHIIDGDNQKLIP